MSTTYTFKKSETSTYNLPRPLSPERVRELAKRGLSYREAAKEVSLCEQEFVSRLRSLVSIGRAWDEGRQVAGITEERRKTPVHDADEEGCIVLQPVDEQVYEALMVTRLRRVKYPLRKRMRHLREITELDTGTLIHSIERLEQNLLVTVHEGLVYTEYERSGSHKSI
jgi:hypothetical protein